MCACVCPYLLRSAFGLLVVSRSRLHGLISLSFGVLLYPGSAPVKRRCHHLCSILQKKLFHESIVILSHSQYARNRSRQEFRIAERLENFVPCFGISLSMSFPYFVCSSLLCLLCRGWQPWSHLRAAWLARQAPVAPDCRGWRRLYHVPDRTKNSLTAQALLLIIEKRECQCSSVGRAADS